MDVTYISSGLPEKLQFVIDRLVDNKTGLIKQLVEIPLQATESLLFIYSDLVNLIRLPQLSYFL